jgi:hypothetical protein
MDNERKSKLEVSICVEEVDREGTRPELTRLKNILAKSPRSRHVSELMVIMPMIKNVQFFKDQDVQAKDLSDVSEWLNYQFCQKGDVLYNFGEP